METGVPSLIATAATPKFISCVLMEDKEELSFAFQSITSSIEMISIFNEKAPKPGFSSRTPPHICKRIGKRHSQNSKIG
jgi:hypothetical protein